MSSKITGERRWPLGLPRRCALTVHYRKRKIGVGQAWKGQKVTVIETTPDQVVVLDRATGVVLSELTIGPAGTYHGTGGKRGRPRKNPTPRGESVVSAMS
jgi:hypothetical protein